MRSTKQPTWPQEKTKHPKYICKKAGPTPVAPTPFCTATAGVKGCSTKHPQMGFSMVSTARENCQHTLDGLGETVPAALSSVPRRSPAGTTPTARRPPTPIGPEQHMVPSNSRSDCMRLTSCHCPVGSVCVILYFYPATCGSKAHGSGTVFTNLPNPVPDRRNRS